MKVLISVFVTVSLANLCSVANALTKEEILKKVDEREYSAKDMVAVTKMELEGKDGSKSLRKMKIFQKGSEKRLIRFLEPADVKGMAFLSQGDEKMYLYLPAMHKIRRIAGHVKNDNFAGTDYSFEDLDSQALSERLLVQEMNENSDHYILTLSPKQGVDSQYTKFEMHVRKLDFAFDLLIFYDQSGKKWKQMSRKDFRKDGKHMQSYWTEMADLKKGHKTRSLIESVEYDTGLTDKFFSKRQLKRR